MTLEEFLARLESRELPRHPLGRVRLLAQELAEGAYEGLWPMELHAFRGQVNDEALSQYLEGRWGKDYPSFPLLSVLGYVEWVNSGCLITGKSFELMGEVQPADIFISYRRRESSAFALLVLARLKSAGLNAFLDMSLVPGEEWKRGLRERIERNDYLISLIGPNTLASGEVVWELESALSAGVTIIPIWHGGFVFRADTHDLPPAVSQMLQTTHTIRVLEESAIGYNNAIIELLNRFGITP